jgi:Zn-dependent protease
VAVHGNGWPATTNGGHEDGVEERGTLRSRLAEAVAEKVAEPPVADELAERPPGQMHRGSLRIARIGGIDILVHWTFPILLVLVAFGATSAAGVGWAILWVVAIFGSVVIHELAHSFVAQRRGVVVLDILLLPFGGLSQMEEMPEEPREEFVIAVVGPIASLGLATILFAGGLVFHRQLWPPTLFARSWFARLAWMNLLLGSFNLLPALPMDGGRVLRAALARRHGRRRATAMAASIARFLAVLMIVGGIFYDLWLALIGLFVLMGANADESMAKRPPKRPPGPAPPDWPSGRGP